MSLWNSWTSVSLRSTANSSTFSKSALRTLESPSMFLYCFNIIIYPTISRPYRCAYLIDVKKNKHKHYDQIFWGCWMHPDNLEMRTIFECSFVLAEFFNARFFSWRKQTYFPSCMNGSLLSGVDTSDVNVSNIAQPELESYRNTKWPLYYTMYEYVIINILWLLAAHAFLH